METTRFLPGTQNQYYPRKSKNIVTIGTLGSTNLRSHLSATKLKCEHSKTDVLSHFPL